MTALRRFLPQAADYAGLRESWRSDVVAGVTVGIVALPLALAFGITSGLGAAAGITTAIVAGLVAAIFGGSNFQVSGPTGAMTVVLVPLVARYGTGAIALVSILAGGLIVLAAALRAGRYLAYAPWPVVEGFTLGIALIIFLQQVPSALGVAKPHGENAAAIAARATGTAVHHAHPTTMLLVLLAVAVMVIAPRVRRTLPGSLIAVTVVTLVAEALDLHVARIGALPSSLPTFDLPSISSRTLGDAFAPAFAVAALAALESLLSARVADGMADRGHFDPDRELFGQGMANIASGAFGGMPATGAIARTAVNVRAGARTRLAASVHALTLAVVVLVGSGLVGRIPIAALAGVLMVTSIRMIEVRNVRAVLGATRSDAVVLIVTAAVTVSLDLVKAVEVGVVIAGALALRHVARSTAAALGASPFPFEAGTASTDGQGGAEDVDGAAQVDRSLGIVTYRLEGALFFGAAERFLRELTAISDVRVVVLRMPRLHVLDATGAHALRSIVEDLEARGTTVLIKGPRPEHERALDAVGVIDALATSGHVFHDLPTALAHAKAHANHLPCQSGTAVA